jgi:hypothetical protein
MSANLKENAKIQMREFSLLLTNISEKRGEIMDLKEYCKKVKEEYPKYISKEQMRIICHISKRKARYLLLNGLIPCKNSGKLTRNYKVKIDDVIKYLKNREEDPQKYKMPCSKKPVHPHYRFKKSGFNKETLLAYYEEIYNEYPDIVNVSDIAKMTGFSISSILKWLQKEMIISFKIKNAYKVPKEFLLQFLVNKYFLEPEKFYETLQK